EVAKAFGFPTKAIQYAVLIGLAEVTVSAVQTVGVILVVAMLITPAATAFLWVKKFSTMMWLAGLLRMVSSIVGMYFSYRWELQSGPASVLVAFAMFLLTFFFSPNQGSIWTQFDKIRERRRLKSTESTTPAKDNTFSLINNGRSPWLRSAPSCWRAAARAMSRPRRAQTRSKRCQRFLFCPTS